MVPFDQQIWSAARCAEYLEVSKSHYKADPDEIARKL